MSEHQLGLCPILSHLEMELEAAANTSTSQLTLKQELWQHIWVAHRLLRSVNYDEGLCRVVEASEVISPTMFGSILAALVCKGKLVGLVYLPNSCAIACVYKYSKCTSRAEGIK